jgi:hypothetical protein
MNETDCPYCKATSTVVRRTLKFNNIMHDEPVEFWGPGRKCLKCDEQWAEREDRVKHFPIMADTLRDNLGLLRMDYLETVRKSYKLSREKFRPILSMSNNRYRDFLAGRLQTPENDRLMRAGLELLLQEGETYD